MSAKKNLGVTLIAAVILVVLAVSRAAEPATQPVGQTTQPAVAATKPTTQPATKPAVKTPAPARTLADCDRLSNAGKYAVAARGYGKLLKQGPKPLQSAAAVGLAGTLSAEGKYAGAIDALNGAREAGDADANWHVAMAEALATVGQYPRALTHAVRANKLKPIWAPTILIRGELLEVFGRTDEAVATYRTMEKVIDADEYRRDARSLVALGRIFDRFAVLTGKRASEQASNILHNYFQEAYKKADKRYWRANLSAGTFLLGKHKTTQALKEFGLATRINKRSADVLVGVASAHLSKWKFEKCLATAGKALAINPNLPDAHLIRAVCMMQWRKFDEVPAIVEKALKVNPNHLEALSLMAAVHVRTRRPEKAKPYIERIGKVNPRYWGLPATIGTWLAAGRQFDQAEKQFKKAIELAPNIAGPITALGRMYMQTGEEDKALSALRRAHELDDYRRDVVNFINILKKLQRFGVRETEHFIVKVNPEHDAVLLDQVADYMEEIYSEICDDFDHEPPVKTIIEIFPTHRAFSARTTGSGWIPTVGACTGRVIALAAPSKERSPMGTHNWAMVLRHEFTHTVTLSGTKNRIPHWFTEACAVWQQPDKRSFRSVNTLKRATQRGKLMSVKDLDWGFIRPKYRGQRSLAYAQSEWIMEHIIETKGYPTIPKMLKGFRDGMTQAEVFEKIVGVAEKEFDKVFVAWAKKVVRKWGYNPDPPPNLARAKKLAKEKPDDADAQARLALALYFRRQRPAAEAAARKALEKDPRHPVALMVLSRTLLSKKKYDEAIAAAQRLIEADGKSSVGPRVLAQCHQARKAWSKAIAALELLKQRQPLDQYSYQRLATLYTQFGRPEKALPNLLYLHRYTMTDHKYARQAAEIYRSLGNDKQALKYFKQVVHINPYEASAYQAMASIHLNAKRYDEAIAAGTKLSLLEPKKAKSWVYLATIRYKTGRARSDREQFLEAKKSAQKAMELDPSSSMAKRLLGLIEKALED